MTPEPERRWSGARWLRAIANSLHMPNRLERTEVAAVEAMETSAVSAIDPDYFPIHKYEFRRYSQNGEDGILLYLFSHIDTTDRRFVEFGVGDGQECNTANLLMNMGWSGLWMDGDGSQIESARDNYGSNTEGRLQLRHCWVTRDNINEVLLAQDIKGSIDLLSIDIDGNDYWVWEALDVIDPRLVVIEYNASMGPTLSVTVKYQADFERFSHHPSGFYHGASLRALTKLANKRGYMLVGCESNGVNAFYVKRNAAEGSLRELTVEEAFVPLRERIPFGRPSEQFEVIKDLEFVEI